MMAQAASDVPLISAQGVAKSFGAIRALRGVSVDFHAGRVHGLVGANGAGKSTFLSVLAGVVAPDEGTLSVEGVRRTIADPRQSADLGFSFIYQELALIPQFSAFENMTIGARAKTPFGLGDRGARLAAARAVAERLRLKIDLHRPVKELSIAERGLVAIGRALVGQARFMAMDEPTASLSDVECQRLFAVVEELTAGGVAVAYVSHRLDEIEALCDDVTVFNDGAVVSRFRRGHYGRDDLIRSMTGRPVEAASAPVVAAPSEGRRPLLEVSRLARAPRVNDVSFKLFPGEILGLAGLVGAGRTEVLRLLFGAEWPTAGQMLLDGAPFAPRTPADAIAKGLALVPEERRSQALVMNETVAFNMNTGHWGASRWHPRLPILHDGRATARARRMSDLLRIKTKSMDTPVRTLSGGNQQKVVFGRWLLRNPRVLLLDEPTRGVDIGARQQIWKTVETFAAAGGAVLVVSSDLEELAVCHRVVVLVEGRDVGEIQAPDITEDRMLGTIYSFEGSHVW